MVVGQGVRWVLWGLGIGLAVALGASFLFARAFSGLLFETPVRDPRTLLLVAALWRLTAVAACLLPALRAIRVSPSVALRND